LLDGKTLADVASGLQVTVFYDLLFTIVAYLTFDYVVEE
jgi:hypothetical protein